MATVTWGKVVYKGVDTSAGAAAFKAALYSLSNVPVERQKLMSKHWKGVLGNGPDADAALAAAPPGAPVTMMGSADSVAKPAEKVVFVEDLPASAAAAAGTALPAGLQNLGNTCYANSPLEALRFIPELKTALVAKSAAPAGPAPSPTRAIATSLGELLTKLDASPSGVIPASFLSRFRAAFPQFDERGAMGGHKQQDSEEFFSSLLTALAAELRAPPSSDFALSPKSPDGPNLVDTLFGVDFEVQMKCTEPGAEAEPPVTRSETARKLICNIDGGAGAKTQVNHLAEGIMLGLTGEVEKHADTLGRNALFSRSARIASLPKYLCVQFMRFFWKATPDSRDGPGVKCKMLRPVSFPADGFDVYDMCTPALQAKLRVGRDKYAAAVGLKKSSTGASDASASSGGGAGSAMVDDGEGAGAATAAAEEPIGYNLPPDFRGTYELFALVTHKGRSADSGHYICWTRKAPGSKTWYVFDDDEVSETDSEYVTSHLKGGGDDHMTYLAFYRAAA